MSDRDLSQKPPDSEFSKRLVLVVVFFVLFLVGIIVMLLNIQIINVRKYQGKAERQYIRLVTEKSQRGVILDRHGRMLAETVETISFYADPQIVRNTPLFNEKGKPVTDRRSGKQKTFDNSGEVARLFSEHLGKGRPYYLKKLRKEKRLAVLGRKVSAVKALPLMQKKIPGVWFDREQQRYYLNVAAQVIGVTDSRNSGISGLELQYDRYLRGRDGSRVFQRSATGKRYPAPDALQLDPIKGHTLRLTIDADIQSIVEDELAATVGRVQASAATGIVMDVRTGEILAMANNPSFDLNRRVTWTPEKSRNRSVTDSFEPGSTFKILMAATATEVLGRKAEDRVFAHNGVLPLFGLRIRDHESYGEITFREAIMHSSNVIAAKTAMETGREKFHSYTRNFGFGSKTGIGLLGESPGRVRPLKNWDKTTLPWMGYGYQVMVTPLQILQAYATIANDGVRMKPYLVKSIIDTEGRTILEHRPKAVMKVVSPETARYLGKEYFKAVVDSGTARNAAIPGMSVAGKTGTARRASGGSYANAVYVSSFVGYFPVESPRYALIVLVEEPRTVYYASTVAAPVFSSIASRMLSCSEELQKNLAFRSPEQAVIDSTTTVVVPDLKGMKADDARRLLKWIGLDMKSSGAADGIVGSQHIKPGSKTAQSGIVRVKLVSAVGKRTIL
ncbi:MAG: transpeptidase family protein [Chlorobium sp.]|uniref:penicillin-binding protein n=1 Tax=Chlorobium sp. TaxID=1095 RepID=UPI001E167DE3|nr:penicillin-binding protein [Chlorobium sp.]MBN1279032.1 transpeptidase family protein [Chlorobiaceae bacterium]MCF8216311.1 transpeptidase family protein [Chlorobium sp.]MCF8271213.1 transpeptidase family protein [Chlorobium sp.]MCF8287587.1 transpeptidase family protein [Chlorobium sp.]MCF8291126.1 transpeptidase family protein [Chlorobium sp.]